MPLIDRIQTDIVAAMKSRDEKRLSALRMVKSALQKLATDSPKPVDEAAEQQMLKSLVKQRTDAAEAFRMAGREESAADEEAERALIETYLPPSASSEDIDAAVKAAIVETGAKEPKQMGLVMKAAQSRLAGKTIDGKLLSERVRARLS